VIVCPSEATSAMRSRISCSVAESAGTATWRQHESRASRPPRRFLLKITSWGPVAPARVRWTRAETGRMTKHLSNRTSRQIMRSRERSSSRRLPRRARRGRRREPSLEGRCTSTSRRSATSSSLARGARDHLLLPDQARSTTVRRRKLADLGRSTGLPGRLKSRPLLHDDVRAGDTGRGDREELQRPPAVRDAVARILAQGIARTFRRSTSRRGPIAQGRHRRARGQSGWGSVPTRGLSADGVQVILNGVLARGLQ